MWWNYGFSSVQEAEAAALLLHALTRIYELDLNNVIVEIHCKFVADPLLHNRSNYTEFGVIVDKCR